MRSACLSTSSCNARCPSNSLRAVLGMGNENGLAFYGFDKSSLAVVPREHRKTITCYGLGVRVRGMGM